MNLLCLTIKIYIGNLPELLFLHCWSKSVSVKFEIYDALTLFREAPSMYAPRGGTMRYFWFHKKIPSMGWCQYIFTIPSSKSAFFKGFPELSHKITQFSFFEDRWPIILKLNLFYMGKLPPPLSKILLKRAIKPLFCKDYRIKGL